MTTKELEEQIKSLYEDFFNDMKIDKQTGIVEGTEKRFSGYPFVGTNYVNAPIKILFIALDTGADEHHNEFHDNTYHDFGSRRERVLKRERNERNKYRSHLAGLNATALYFLKSYLGYQEVWETLWGYRDRYKVVKAINSVLDSLPKDLLNYVSYCNRYRFVTVNRAEDERQGDKDRKWINAKRESKLLMEEIDVFSPDVIVFQGKTGIWNCKINELKKKYKVVILNHPSCWQRGADKLQYIVNEIESQIKL